MTLNVNGIRAAARKGFFSWLAGQDLDFVCLQEVRASAAQLLPEMRPPGFHAQFLEAEKPGYSGVALYSRQEPDRVERGLGWPDLDGEGRYLRADFGRLSVVSLYLPSGSSGEERQRIKFRFLERFTPRLREIRESGREWLLCGDWNIAHRPIDLKNWRANQASSGFLPEERAWMEHLFGELGFVDSFRRVNQQPEQYTWWSSRGQAWAKNVGWRIDYQVATPDLGQKALKAVIYKEQRFSDHAPLMIEYNCDMRIFK